MSQKALADELKVLRKGRGVHTPKIDDVVGPELRSLCAITRRDSAGVIREKVISGLADGSRKLPADLREAVLAALALSADWQDSLLQDRVRRLAEREKRDVRTIRRRIDDGIELLAQVAGNPATGSSGAKSDGWRVERVESLLRMDLKTPVCYERRTIVAETDGIEQIRESFSLPRTSGADRDHRINVDVQFGVRLVETVREHDTRFAFILQLPRPLRIGEYLEYGLVIGVPDGQSMRSHYVFFPKRACDQFDLRVRFKPEEAPQEVWSVREAFHRDIDDPEATGNPEAFNGVGELQLQFTDLEAGHGYGAQWSPR